MRSVVVGTAGHIDHGKSALVRALTGTDPDRLKEEQERGITIDLGFAHLQLGDVSLAFVDVPGHERFVRNMLAGVGGMDLVMLVVAADESVMPQTREHFEICRLLGVPSGLVVLSKSDLADQEMRDLAALEVRELTTGSFLADAPILAVSARSGAGLEELRSALASLAARAVRRPEERPARLPIDRVFSVKGFGTVVTGTLVAGRLERDDELVVRPGGRPVKVRGLQVHGGVVDSAAAGQRVAVNVGGAEVPDLARGDTLCAPGSLDETRRVDVALETLADARPLRHGARVRFHQGTTEVLGRVALAGAGRGEGVPAEVAGGGAAYARIRLEAPAVVTRGDRFILRAYSPPVTIGGGVILDPHPPRGAIRTAAGQERFRRLDAGADREAAAVLGFVEDRGALGLPHAALVWRAGLAKEAADRLVDRLVRDARVVSIEAGLFPAAVVDRLSGALIDALKTHHRQHPLAEGMPREEARERIFGRAAPAVFDHVITRLVEDRRIVAREHLAMAGHQVSLTDQESCAIAALEQVFAKAGLAPPDLAGAAAATSLSGDLVERMVNLLVRRHRLVRLEGLHFHADALESLKAEVRGLKERGTPKVDIATFKERYAITRKYAIPLLEYLDRERVTRRAGESRVIL